MTYPNQPQPGYPPSNVPPANYPPSNVPLANFIPPGYPPQYPQQQYPAPWVPAGYPAQPQGYAPPAAPAPAQPVLARGTLEEYLDQPSGGGGAATSKFFTDQRPVGSWLQLRVARDLNHSDVRQQTDKFGTPLTFKSSGKPKLVLIIPCQVIGSSDGSHTQLYTEGICSVWLKGVPSDSFKQAMAAAGISNPIEALRLGQLQGAEFYMIGAGKKQFGQGNPANMFDFQYTPNGRELLAAAPNPTQGATLTAPVPPVAPTVSAPPAYAPPAAPPQAPPQPQFAPMDPAGYQAAGSPPFPPAPPQMPPVPPPGIPAAPPAPAGPSGAATMPSSPPPPPGYAPQPQYQQAPPPPPGYAPQPQYQQAPPPPPGYAPQAPVPGAPQLDDEKARLLNRLNGQG